MAEQELVNSMNVADDALVLYDVDLQALNSFGLPARAQRLALLHAAAQWPSLRARYGTPALVLGAGSNVLLCDDIDGLVLQVAIGGRGCVDEDEQAWYIEAGAGENWAEFVDFTLANGWHGLENLSAIPGTIGAAPVQNIGAYGREVADFVDSVYGLELASGKACRWSAQACEFSYRDSIFKRHPQRWLITRVRFRLPKKWQPCLQYEALAQALATDTAPTAQALAGAVKTLRQKRLPDPAKEGNAGSFFQNPQLTAAAFAALQERHPDIRHFVQPDGGVRLAAAWLIEQCGWRGRALGAVAMSAEHALIMINRGQAHGGEVIALAEAIQRDVAARFGVRLELEPVVIGRPRKP